MTDTPPEEVAPEAAADAPAEAPAEAAVAVETDPVREAIIEQLAGQFKDAIVGTHIAKADLWVRVANASWHDVVAYAKNVMGFRFFDFLAGLDWLNNTNLSAEKAWGADGGRGPRLRGAPRSTTSRGLGD